MLVVHRPMVYWNVVQYGVGHSQMIPTVLGSSLIAFPSPPPRLGAAGLPLVLQALHTYHIAEHERDVVDYSSIEERNACDAAQRLVSMLCERLCSAWGSSAVVSAANTLR